MSTNSTTTTTTRVSSTTSTTTATAPTTTLPTLSPASSSAPYFFSQNYDNTLFGNSPSGIDDEFIILRATQLLGLLSGLLGNSLSAFFSVRIQTVAEIIYYQRKHRSANGCSTGASSFGFEPLIASPIVSIPVSNSASTPFSFPSNVDALVGNSVIVFGLFILHWILPKLVSCCGKFKSIRQHGGAILSFHRIVARLAWLFFFSLLHSSISFGVRLIDTRSSSSRGVTDGEIAIGSILGIALPCLLALLAAFRNYDVRWSPVGAWAEGNDLIKLHGLDLFPELQVEQLENITNNNNATKTKGEDDGNDDDESKPKLEPTMTLENALLGSRSEAAFAIKSIIEKRKQMSAEEVEKERAVRDKAKENRRRKFLGGELRGGKWITNLVVTADAEDDTKERGKPATSATIVEKIDSSNHKLRYGSLFMDFRVDHQRFFALQLFVSITLGVLHSLASFNCAHFNAAADASILGIQASDDAFTYAIAAILALEALVFIALQPCRFFLDNLFYTFVLLGGNAAAGCALLVAGSGRLSGLADYFVQVCECIILAFFCIKFFVDLILRIAQMTQSCCLSSTSGDSSNDVDDRIWEKEFDILGVNNCESSSEKDKNKNEKKEDDQNPASSQSEKKPVKNLAEFVQLHQSVGSNNTNNNNNNNNTTVIINKNNSSLGIHQNNTSTKTYSIASGNRIVVVDKDDEEASPLRTFNRMEDEKYARKHGQKPATTANPSSRSSSAFGNSAGELDWDYDEQEREMRIIATKNTIERLQAYASRPHVELDGDDEKTREAKRSVHRGLPAGLETFLSLTPPEDKTKENNNYNNSTGVSLQPNGLVEGITIGPPIAFGDLRLDYSPNYTEERAPPPPENNNNNNNNNRPRTITFREGSNEEEGSPVAPLRTALRNLKGLDQESLSEENEKQTNELNTRRKEKEYQDHDEEKHHDTNHKNIHNNEDGDDDADDSGFSFAKAMGSRPDGSDKDKERNNNDNNNNNNKHGENDESSGEDNEHDPPNLSDEDASPANPFADLNNQRNADEMMRRLDITNNSGGRGHSGMDIDNNNNKIAERGGEGALFSRSENNSAAKRLRSLELAGNFLTGAFSVPPLPIMQQQHHNPSSQRAGSNFRDPYHDEFYGSKGERNINSNNNAVDFDEDLPYPLPPVRIDKDDYYGAAHTNNNPGAMAAENNNTKRIGAHGPLNEYSPGRAKKDVQEMMSSNNTNNSGGTYNMTNRPLFSGYFAPTPAARQLRRGGGGGGGGVHEEFLSSPSQDNAVNNDETSNGYQTHQPPLRNKDPQRPLMKVFAMQQGILGNNNNNNHDGHAFVDGNKANFYSSMTPAAKERQKQMDAFFFSPAGGSNNFSPPSTSNTGRLAAHQNHSHASVVNISTTPTPSRKTFAKVEEL